MRSVYQSVLAVASYILASDQKGPQSFNRDCYWFCCKTVIVKTVESESLGAIPMWTCFYPDDNIKLANKYKKNYMIVYDKKCVVLLY